jgi:hypothetical protein
VFESKWWRLKGDETIFGLRNVLVSLSFFPWLLGTWMDGIRTLKILGMGKISRASEQEFLNKIRDFWSNDMEYSLGFFFFCVGSFWGDLTSELRVRLRV